MSNEAYFSVTGYVATQPVTGTTRSGVPTLSMRIGWTPRRLDQGTGEWVDEPTSFASLKCYRKIAENGFTCLHKGDPVTVKGRLRVREYQDQAGVRRTSVDIVADSLGHDLSKGMSFYSRPRPPAPQQGQERSEADEAVPASGVAGRSEGDVAAEPGDRFVDDDEPLGEHDAESAVHVAEDFAVPV